jgi:hypothetical protein
MEALAKVRERYGDAVSETESALLALAWLEGRPLRAGSDAHDAAILARARVMADSGLPGREALARAREETAATPASVFCDFHQKQTTVRSVAAGFVYLACGCRHREEEGRP